MAATLLERRYPPIGNGFVDVDIPSHEQYSFHIEALWGAGVRRSRSLTGLVPGGETLPNLIKREPTHQCLQGPQSKLSNYARCQSQLGEVPLLQDSSAAHSGSDFDAPPEELPTEQEQFASMFLQKADLNSRVSQTPPISDISRQQSSLQRPFPSDDTLSIPKSFQSMLNSECGKDAELDSILAKYGWTGTDFLHPPDWGTYIQICTRANTTLNSSSRLYNLLAAGQGIQDANAQSEQLSAPCTDPAQASWDCSGVMESARGKEQTWKHPLLIADSLPEPNRLPRKQQESPVNRAGKARITTLMIQHLPLETQQRDILEELDRSGFKDQYDFCHVPCDFSKKTGLGFAFVNFISESTAAMFMTEWHGSYRFSKQLPLNIRPAALQGYEDNVNKWSSQRLRRIRNPNFRPFIVEKPKPSITHSVVNGSEALTSSSSIPSMPPTMELGVEAPPESAVPLSIPWLSMS